MEQEKVKKLKPEENLTEARGELHGENE